MKLTHPQVLDVTRTHSQLIPILFPEARDLKTTAALFALPTASHSSHTPAFALLAAPLGMEHSAFRCDIQLPDACPPDIADMLVAHLIHEARSLRAPSLECQRPLPAGALAAALQHHGFTSRLRTLRYGFSLPSALALFSDALTALRHAGRVPDDVERIAYSSPAHGTALSELCQREFGLLTHGHLRALGLYPADGRDHALSSAYLHQGRLVGAWACGTRDGNSLFDPLLIAPGWRNTWAFPYVITDVLERLVTAGITDGHAQIHASNRKMLAVMARIGAQVLDAEDLYACPLDGNGNHSA